MLAWMVVWWNQDVRAAVSAAQVAIQLAPPKSSPEILNAKDVATAKTQKAFGIEIPSTASIISWLGTFIGLGLFWAGGLLVFRPLTGWGFCLPWLRRCDTVERLSVVSAATLTFSAIVLHWFWSHIHAWMFAAVIALFVLAWAFGWKLPGKKQP